MRDLLVDRLVRQSLFHDERHLVLQEQPVDAAHHHDAIERHEQSGHGRAETKSAVEKNERDGEKSEPDMGAEPALYRANPPEHHSFAQAEERAKDKNRKGRAAENQADGRAANAAMLRNFLDERGGQAEAGRQARWIKIPDVDPAGGDRRKDDEEEPGNVRAVRDSHRARVLTGDKVLHEDLPRSVDARILVRRWQGRLLIR